MCTYTRLALPIFSAGALPFCFAPRSGKTQRPSSATMGSCTCQEPDTVLAGVSPEQPGISSGACSTKTIFDKLRSMHYCPDQHTHCSCNERLRHRSPSPRLAVNIPRNGFQTCLFLSAPLVPTSCCARMGCPSQLAEGVRDIKS